MTCDPLCGGCIKKQKKWDNLIVEYFAAFVFLLSLQGRMPMSAPQKLTQTSLSGQMATALGRTNFKINKTERLKRCQEDALPVGAGPPLHHLQACRKEN